MRRIVWASVGIIGAIAACSTYGSDDPAPETPDAGDAATLPDAADAGLALPSESLDGGRGSADATAATSKYGAAVLVDGPVAYWRMSLVDGVVPNVIAQAPALIPSSSAPVMKTEGALTNEPSDPAVLLSGGILVASDPTAYDFTNQSFTVECWSKFTNPIQEQRTPVLGKWTASNGPLLNAINGYALAAEATLESVIILGGTLTSVTATTSVGVNMVNVWHHYAVVVDANVALFIDGELVTQAAAPAAARPTSKPSVAFVVGGLPGSSMGHFLGAVDEVAIYDRPLTSNRIQAHFQAAH